MKNQFNCIQNVKLSQLTNETLIIGVDIAKEFNVARAFDFKGVELSKKEFTFSNYFNVAKFEVVSLIDTYRFLMDRL